MASRLNFQTETTKDGAVVCGALQADGYDLRIGKDNRPLPCRADRKEIIEQAKLVLAEARAIAEHADQSFALRFAEWRAGCTNDSVSGLIEPDIPTENNPSLLHPKCGMANIPNVPPGQFSLAETRRLLMQAKRIQVTISRADDPFPVSRLNPSGLRRRVCISKPPTKATLRLAIRTVEQIVRFSCHQCRKRVETNRIAAGKYTSCPYCGCGLVVPSA